MIRLRFAIQGAGARNRIELRRRRPGAYFEFVFTGKLATIHFDLSLQSEPYPHLWVSVDGRRTGRKHTFSIRTGAGMQRRVTYSLRHLKRKRGDAAPMVSTAGGEGQPVGHRSGRFIGVGGGYA